MNLRVQSQLLLPSKMVVGVYIAPEGNVAYEHAWFLNEIVREVFMTCKCTDRDIVHILERFSTIDQDKRSRSSYLDSASNTETSLFKFDYSNRNRAIPKGLVYKEKIPTTLYEIVRSEQSSVKFETLFYCL